MTFSLEFVDDYTQELEFFCPEKELTFYVDISGAYDEQTEDYNQGEVERIVDKAFGEAFGEGVNWKF